MLELTGKTSKPRVWLAREASRGLARRRLLVSAVLHLPGGLRCTRSLLSDERTLRVGLRGRQLLAVASSTPLAILRTLGKVRLLTIEAAVVSSPGLAMVAADCGRLQIPFAGIARCELAVRVGICRADHIREVNATLRQFGSELREVKSTTESNRCVKHVQGVCLTRIR